MRRKPISLPLAEKRQQWDCCRLLIIQLLIIQLLISPSLIIKPIPRCGYTETRSAQRRAWRRVGVCVPARPLRAQLTPEEREENPWALTDVCDMWLSRASAN